MSAPDPARAPGIPRVPLLVVIDPVARLTDGESVRIARDVLCAGSTGVKVCLPEDPEETARALSRRGSRRPVLVGNDRALLRVVQYLHREGALDSAALAVVPVGNGPSVALARGLGLPLDVVAAARAVLAGAERRLDLLADDGEGVVLGGLHIPAGPAALLGPPPTPPAPASPPGTAPPPPPSVPSQRTGPPPGAAAGPSARGDRGGPVMPGERGGSALPGERDGRAVPGERVRPGPAHWRRAARSLARSVLARTVPARPGASGASGAPGAPGTDRAGAAGTGVDGTGAARTGAGAGAGAVAAEPVDLAPPEGLRLRVEADGKLLADVDEPVTAVSVRTTDDGGLAEVTVRPGPHIADPSPVTAMARTVTVSGPAFRYRADSTRVGGPLPTRTWTVHPQAWRLVLPPP